MTHLTKQDLEEIKQEDGKNLADLIALNIGQIGENLEGDVIDVILVKGERGFGFTIVGGDEPGEMIQINAIVATGNPRPSGKVNFHFLSFSIG